jgi:hypothetical protein
MILRILLKHFMNGSGTPAILLPYRSCLQKIFRFGDHLALSCEAARSSRTMFTRFAVCSLTTVAKFLRALQKESKRSPRSDSQDCMWLLSEVISQRACRFSGLVRLCFVSSAKPLPSYGFSAISQVSTRSSKTIKRSNPPPKPIPMLSDG